MPKKGTMKAYVECPWCHKPDALLLLTARRGGSGVDNKLYTHEDAEHKAETGSRRGCVGSGREIPNRDLPPMSEWREW